MSSADNNRQTLTAAGLAEYLKAELVGDGAAVITGANSVEQAADTEVAFLRNDEPAERLCDTKAAAVILGRRIPQQSKTAQLVVPSVESALIETLELFAPQPDDFNGVHPKAAVEKNAHLGPNVSVGPGAYIGSNVAIGENSVIGPGCIVEHDTVIGSSCRLDGNVVVYRNCRIGNNCVIQANTTIGSAGFGYYFIKGSHRLIPHNGAVVIEDNVEIGANCCIDRAKFGNTIIGAGTRIDNLVQIAHNAVTGKNCLIAGQSGLAGSARLEDGVIMAGQSGVGDHIKVAAGTMIGARAGITADVPAGGSRLMGMPAMDAGLYRRNMVAFRHLHLMDKELKRIALKVEKIEAAENDKN